MHNKETRKYKRLIRALHDVDGKLCDSFSVVKR